MITAVTWRGAPKAILSYELYSRQSRKFCNACSASPLRTVMQIAAATPALSVSSLVREHPSARLAVSYRMYSAGRRKPVKTCLPMCRAPVVGIAFQYKVRLKLMPLK